MTTLFLIDRIEGNSNIGVPVFSRKAKHNNSNYVALSPRREFKPAERRQDKFVIAKSLEKFLWRPAQKEIEEVIEDP